MPSPLDYNNSERFRSRLMTRNLAPYPKSPNRPNPPITYEYQQSQLAVTDSPDVLIDSPILANRLYPLNQFGAEGGYRIVGDVGGLNNTRSNQGEYGPGQQDAHIIDQAQPASLQWKPKNAYSNGSQTVLDSGEYITEPDYIRSGSRNLYNNQPYPTTFVPSSYNPVQILLTRDPQGSNGLLTQDSYIARLGAFTLRRSFEERIATEIRQQTLGRINLFNIDSGTDIFNLLTTRVPLIEPNWVITQPSGPILAATDFALRLAGSILPTSPIPGSYFDPSINSGFPTTIQQLQAAFTRSNTSVGNFFGQLLGPPKSGSQIFLNNTGGGQKSRLFGSINYNKYKPGYERNIFDRVGGALFGTTVNNSNYYIGSPTSEPSRVFSPTGDLPNNEFGQEVQAPVYGPQELAQLYEGPSREIKLGANGPAYINGGGIEGGFTWVSPKYRGNAGKKVGIGGEVTQLDEDFKPSSYNSTESVNLEFRQGSILDDTQRIINSQPQGGRRLQHVGNAMDQVSKVFNDGYKELTKGSRVLRYVGSLGNEVGTEYCRVFAKDIPYLQYNDLQKQDGVVNEGRRFSYSVFDKTYNLNIVPNKQEGGQASSNLIGTNNTAFAKKYMFSLENLAWRTSNTPGINVNELPICERGPNGGRVMWFPPYGLTFNETVNANWKTQDFLGRPEPIYTYTNTSRGGSLQWKIVVDHPSVLNVIVNKVLNNESNKERINGILESFFAGCKKYDLYELAKRYYTIPPNELQDIQQAIASKNLSKEQVSVAKNTLATGARDTQSSSQPITQPSQNTPQDTLKQFQNFALYFPNDIPAPPSVSPVVGSYSQYYTDYINQSTTTYAGQGVFINNVVTQNYNHIQVNFFNELKTVMKNNPSSKVVIELLGSASAAAKQTYNLELSQRRIDSVKNLFASDQLLNSYIQSGRITFTEVPKGEGAEKVQVFQWDASSNQFITNTEFETCTDNDDNNNSLAGAPITNSTAMACRRVKIKSITVSAPEPSQLPPNVVPTQPTTGIIPPTPPTTVEPKFRKTDNISKRIVRALISECDYFETIKQDSPMLYDNLKDKLKFFQPSFHSTTPEGLNSRLTFLQQCMRPGDTIPTVKATAGGAYELEYNNAVNTAFGTPPVLILRVGDFYNTKIIPTSLSLNFEGLDINPEGIGIQPMIANVTLNFNFVGGQGLKTAVDKLQNALTFNYYANTEMWDDRADPTDDSFKVLDKEFLQSVAQPTAPTTNQIQNIAALSNSTTIGDRLTNVITATDETGKISYKGFMDTFVSTTQTYFTSVFNQSKSIFSQYNNAMLQQWSIERKYQEGTFYTDPNTITYLYGKADNLQKNINKVFTDMIAQINAGQDPWIEWINNTDKDFSRAAKNQMKQNYLDFVRAKQGTFINAATTIVQDVVNTQQAYLQYISRANIVPYSGTSWDNTDGFQETNGNVVIYWVSGTTGVGPVNAGNPNPPTTTSQEIDQDIDLIKVSLNDFYTKLTSDVNFSVGSDSYTGILVRVNSTEINTIINDVFFPFSKNPLFSGNPFKRQYMILSNDLKGEAYESFKNAMIGNLLENQSLAPRGASMRYSEEFDAYWRAIVKPAFDEEDTLTQTFLNEMETNQMKNFLNFTPFPLGKPREFNYAKSSAPDPNQEVLIKSLGAKTNQNTDNKWNTPTTPGGDVLISKVKLN